MKSLNFLKQNLVYEKTELMINNFRNLQKNTILFLLKDSEVKKNNDEYIDISLTKKVLEDRYLYTDYFYGLYLMRDIDFNPFYKKKIFLKLSELNEKFTEEGLDDKLKGIYPRVPQYQGRNLIVDLTTYFNYYHNKTNIIGYEREKTYISLLERELKRPEYDTYVNKILLIPVSFEMDNFNENFSELFKFSGMLNRNNGNPLSYIFRQYMKETVEDSKFPAQKILTEIKNLRIIFYDFFNERFFFLNMNEPLPFNTFKLRLFYFVKSINGKFSQITSEEMHEGNKSEPVLKPIANDVFNALKVKQKVDSKVKNNAVKDVSDSVFNKISTMISDVTERSEKGSFGLVRTAPRDKKDFKKNILSIVNKTNDIINESGDEDEVLNKINNDEDIKKEVLDMSSKKLKSNLEVHNKISEKLSKEEKKVSVTYKNKVYKNVDLEKTKLEDIVKIAKDKEIKVERFSKPKSLDEQLAYSSFKSFLKEYKDKSLDKDIIKVFSSFSKDKENPLFVKSIKIKDVSDQLNYKTLYTIIYKDKGNKSHTFSIEIPVLIDGKFIFINNSKKIILNQLISLPLSKSDPDEVYLTTNYTKFQIFRNNKKFDKKFEKFRKMFLEDYNELKKNGIDVTNIKSSDSFDFSIEYSSFKSFFSKIHFKKLSTTLYFDSKEARNYLIKNEVFDIGKIPDKFLFLGINTKNNIFYFVNEETGEVFSNIASLNEAYQVKKVELNKAFNKISDLILYLGSNSYDKFEKLYSEKSSGKKFVYSSITILNKKVPLIVILGNYAGLLNVLEEYKIEYKLSDKRLQSEDSAIKFKDTYLYYKDDIKSSLLLSGLNEIDTNLYNISEFSDIKPYADYFEKVLKINKIISRGFNFILDRMLDPITEEVLVDLNLPKTITGLLLEANTMLVNSKFIKKNSPYNYRLRCGEIIPSYLYKVISDAYNRYINYSEDFSVPKDKLIKVLLESKALDNFSSLNPAFEIDQLIKTTLKGNSGLNSEHAYTSKVRAYNKDMQGLFGNYSSPSSDSGINKYLTLNPKIISTRGYIDKNSDSKKSSELFCPNELINPFNSRFSDPMRQIMTLKQTSHIVPTDSQSKPLVGSGFERNVKSFLGKDFVIEAKDNGHVESIDKKNKLLVVRYDDGFQEVINLDNQISKNSASGFYISNILKTELKVKDKFKKGDILAKNEDFFKGEKDDVVFSVGTLAKVAIVPLSDTLEDSSLVTERFADKMNSEIIYKEPTNFNINTNISFIAKVGDEVKVGDPLVKFESNIDSKQGLDILEKIGKEYKETISELVSNTKRAKVSGKIEDIKIYFNKDLESFTPSVKKIIKDYISGIKEKYEKINSLKLKEPPNIILPSISKINSERIMNEIVDGVLIEFYISHKSGLTIGDKITMQSACKTIISKTFPSNKEPYSEYNKDEKIDVIFSPLSIVSRMTIDLLNLLFTGKVLIELKKQIKDIIEKD